MAIEHAIDAAACSNRLASRLLSARVAVPLIAMLFSALLMIQAVEWTLSHSDHDAPGPAPALSALRTIHAPLTMIWDHALRAKTIGFGFGFPYMLAVGLHWYWVVRIWQAWARGSKVLHFEAPTARVLMNLFLASISLMLAGSLLVGFIAQSKSGGLLRNADGWFVFSCFVWLFLLAAIVWRDLRYCPWKPSSTRLEDHPL